MLQTTFLRQASDWDPASLNNTTVLSLLTCNPNSPKVCRMMLASRMAA